MDDRRDSGIERETPRPEVLEKPVRRRFTAEYKLRILAEADACTETGQLGELLRREGLYSSHLSTWRRQRDEEVLAGLAPSGEGGRRNRRIPWPTKLWNMSTLLKQQRVGISGSVVDCGTLPCVLSRETGLPLVALVLQAMQAPIEVFSGMDRKSSARIGSR